LDQILEEIGEDMLGQEKKEDENSPPPPSAIGRPPPMVAGVREGAWRGLVDVYLAGYNMLFVFL
jgi:hypothetical protein